MNVRICPNCFSTKVIQQSKCAVCGYNNTQVRDTRALPLGKTLHNRYAIGRVLGIGGFGITYVAFDMEYRERVAIKEYFPAE